MQTLMHMHKYILQLSCTHTEMLHTQQVPISIHTKMAHIKVKIVFLDITLGVNAGRLKAEDKDRERGKEKENKHRERH